MACCLAVRMSSGDGPAPFLVGADHDGDALLLDRLMRSIPRRSYMRGTVRAEEAVQDPPTERNTKRAPGLRQSVSGLGTYFVGDRQVKLLTLQEDRLLQKIRLLSCLIRRRTVAQDTPRARTVTLRAPPGLEL